MHQNNPGYIKLGDEIIKINSVGANTLNTLTRGIDGTVAQPHNPDDLVLQI